MKIGKHTSLVGFLVALSTLTISNVAKAATPSELDKTPQTSASIEDRLSRLSMAFQNRTEQLPAQDVAEVEDQHLAQGFANGRRGGWGDGGGGSWLNGRRGGWADGRGGSFVNSNRWRNGWSDVGRFSNWLNGRR